MRSLIWWKLWKLQLFLVICSLDLEALHTVIYLFIFATQTLVLFTLFVGFFPFPFSCLPFLLFILFIYFFIFFYLWDGTGQEQTAVTIASVQQTAAFSDHNIQYQFRTEGGQVCNQWMKMSPSCYWLFQENPDFLHWFIDVSHSIELKTCSLGIKWKKLKEFLNFNLHLT